MCIFYQSGFPCIVHVMNMWELHYRDGTTDVTRTLHFGTPSKYVQECFTRVLKGVISMATCIFPSKIKVWYPKANICLLQNKLVLSEKKIQEKLRKEE